MGEFSVLITFKAASDKEKLNNKNIKPLSDHKYIYAEIGEEKKGGKKTKKLKIAKKRRKKTHKQLKKNPKKKAKKNKIFY